MYATVSFKTKKALKEAVAEGRLISVFNPGIGAGNEPVNGTAAIEGPNFQMHSWYAEITLTNGIITKVK